MSQNQPGSLGRLSVATGGWEVSAAKVAAVAEHIHMKPQTRCEGISPSLVNTRALHRPGKQKGSPILPGAGVSGKGHNREGQRQGTCGSSDLKCPILKYRNILSSLGCTHSPLVSQAPLASIVLSLDSPLPRRTWLQSPLSVPQRFSLQI